MAYTTTNNHDRRPSHVADYISNLNHIPSERELQAQNDFKFDDDLALFTNATFFDFDMSHSADLTSPTTSAFAVEESSLAVASPATVTMKPMEFGDLGFADFNTFSRPAPATLSPIITKTPYTESNDPTSPLSGLVSPSNDPTQLKRKLDNITSPESIEEFGRLAAEEDKRRRNTAASARFRVKKKQREQALEKSAKEMSDKVAALEGRINQLETENKWLKNLITEKNSSSSSPQKHDLSHAWKRFNSEQTAQDDRSSKHAGERIKEERKDGVGTTA